MSHIIIGKGERPYGAILAPEQQLSLSCIKTYIRLMRKNRNTLIFMIPYDICDSFKELRVKCGMWFAQIFNRSIKFWDHYNLNVFSPLFFSLLFFSAFLFIFCFILFFPSPFWRSVFKEFEQKKKRLILSVSQ